MIATFHKVKEMNGKTYYSHTCKICTVASRKDYMKVYHATNYVSKKKEGNPPLAPDEIAEYPLIEPIK